MSDFSIKKENGIGKDIKVSISEASALIDKEKFQELIDQINKKFDKIYIGLTHTWDRLMAIEDSRDKMSEHFKGLIKELSDPKQHLDLKKEYGD